MTAWVLRVGSALSGAPSRQRQALLGMLGFGLFFATWGLISYVSLVSPRYFPPVGEVFADLLGLFGEAAFWAAVLETIRGWAIGLLVVMVVGVPVGMVVGTSTVLRDITASTIDFLRPIPSVALIPLAVLLFGTTPNATRLMILYSCFWPVLLQTIHGVQDVDPIAREIARSFRFRAITRLRLVTWPSALPYVVTGFRLAASLALILEITGELVIGTPGLGRSIVLAQSGGQVGRLYAFVLVAGFLGVVVNVVARAVERRVLRWHSSVRRDVLL